MVQFYLDSERKINKMNALRITYSIRASYTIHIERCYSILVYELCAFHLKISRSNFWLLLQRQCIHTHNTHIWYRWMSSANIRLLNFY